MTTGVPGVLELGHAICGGTVHAAREIALVFLWVLIEPGHPISLVETA